LHIPYAYGAISRGEETTVCGVVEAIDFLLMLVEDVTDAFFGDVPYLLAIGLSDET